MFVFSAVIVAGLVLNSVGHVGLVCFVWINCGLGLMCCCFILFVCFGGLMQYFTCVFAFCLDLVSLIRLTMGCGALIFLWLV